MPAPHLCVIDIEASGFGRHSYPIEVGYVLPDGRACCTLIRPPEHWTHWDDEAERVHHISRATLMRHGRPTAEVAQMLNTDLRGLTVYCDGWGHDYPWLAALFDDADLTPGFRLESVRALLDETLLARLPALQREALHEMGAHRHRASTDARALQLALARAQLAPGAAGVIGA